MTKMVVLLLVMLAVVVTAVTITPETGPSALSLAGFNGTDIVREVDAMPQAPGAWLEASASLLSLEVYSSSERLTKRSYEPTSVAELPLREEVTTAHSGVGPSGD